MNSYYRFIISVLLLVFANQYAFADQYNNTQLTSILDNVDHWLNANYKFPKQHIEKPNLKIVNKQELCDMAYSETIVANENGICEKIKGLYNYKNTTIYISDKLDLRKKSGKAIILHELVHHYQFGCGMVTDYTCWDEIEVLAKKLEKKYMRDN